MRNRSWLLNQRRHRNPSPNRHLSRHVRSFCIELQRQGRIPAELTGRFHGHAYLLYHHSPRPLLQTGALLIGDAAGLAYPESGEGIRPAVESALLAADCILTADGDYSRSALVPYARQLEKRFGRRQRPPPPPWLSALTRAVGRRILCSPWATRQLVIERWFLHRNQAALGLGG